MAQLKGNLGNLINDLKTGSSSGGTGLAGAIGSGLQNLKNIGGQSGGDMSSSELLASQQPEVDRINKKIEELRKKNQMPLLNTPSSKIGDQTVYMTPQAIALINNPEARNPYYQGGLQ